MASVVYFNSPDTSHTYGISIITTCKATAENFMYNQIIPLCNDNHCNYFIQGNTLKDSGGWVFIEFIGAPLDKVKQVIEQFEQKYLKGDVYIDNELKLEETITPEFLKKYNLWRL